MISICVIDLLVTFHFYCLVNYKMKEGVRVDQKFMWSLCDAVTRAERALVL